MERGYDYYCDNAVENLDVAEDGNNCKHMAAVLYEWSEEEQIDAYQEENEEIDEDIFGRPSNMEEYRKKIAAIERIVYEADDNVVRFYLAAILSENEKLLVRFNSIIHKQLTEEDVERYIDQVDSIANRYLGRNHFISYYEAVGFISELEEILDEDVRRMIDNADYMSAFRLMNYIFELIGNADMDEKKGMFSWFTEHLDGSIIDYLEEYIEQIIMDGFCEKEFKQLKLQFIEDMINKSSLKDSNWSRSYHMGKWAIRYLEMVEKQKNSKAQIEEFCRKYWDNSSVRRYYIDFCMKNRDYVHALEVLDESISMDKAYRGLTAEYSKKKKDIFLLQGDKDAYIGQLVAILRKMKKMRGGSKIVEDIVEEWKDHYRNRPAMMDELRRL